MKTQLHNESIKNLRQLLETYEKLAKDVREAIATIEIYGFAGYEVHIQQTMPDISSIRVWHTSLTKACHMANRFWDKYNVGMPHRYTYEVFIRARGKLIVVDPKDAMCIVRHEHPHTSLTRSNFCIDSRLMERPKKSLVYDHDEQLPGYHANHLTQPKELSPDSRPKEKVPSLARPKRDRNPTRTLVRHGEKFR